MAGRRWECGGRSSAKPACARGNAPKIAGRQTGFDRVVTDYATKLLTRLAEKIFALCAVLQPPARRKPPHSLVIRKGESETAVQRGHGPLLDHLIGGGKQPISFAGGRSRSTCRTGYPNPPWRVLRFPCYASRNHGWLQGTDPRGDHDQSARSDDLFCHDVSGARR